jgi:ribosomal protein S12 methylthiotransferase accessory factor
LKTVANSSDSETLFFSDGALRIRSPQETLKWILPKFSKLGISRLADVTHLDYIGIPTWQAIRPRALTLSVSQGKGCTHEHAKVSAAMESIEFAAWENYSPTVHWYTIEQLPIEKTVLPNDLSYSIYNNIKKATILPWTEMIDLYSNQSFWVISDYICVQRLGTHHKTPKWAYTSTNGLASGNSLEEAQLHSLLELIERDAECCANVVMMNDKIARPRITKCSIKSNYVNNLIHQIESNNCQVVIFSNPNEFGVYCYSAYISDNLNLFYSNIGHGAHVDPNIALSRAITEAAQGRITMISGSREDNYRIDYRYIGDVGKTIFERCQYEISISKTESLVEESSFTLDSISSIMKQIFNRMEIIGFDKIIYVDLIVPEIDVPVVKMIVPGLSGYHQPLQKRIIKYRNWRKSIK